MIECCPNSDMAHLKTSYFCKDSPRHTIIIKAAATYYNIIIDDAVSA